MFNEKEYKKQWHILHKEFENKKAKQWKKEHPGYQKQWRKDNPKKCSEYYKNNIEYKEQWDKEHLGYNKKYSKQRRKEHPEYDKEYSKQYRKNHPEYKRQYYKTLKGKLNILKGHCKRKRNLGFIPLNKPFANCEAHHISENFVIFIPKTIHRSLYHNIWTWQGMNKINKLAMEYL